MSDGTLVAKLSGDTTIKAVMYADTTLKAKLTGGLTVNQVVDGGEYIHFEVTTTANNQTFTNNNLAQYAGVDSINLLKNGVFVEPTNFTKPSANSIQVNILLTDGDQLDVLATGSATTVVPSGGSNTQVQYNNDGVFSGSNSFTFNNLTNTVNITTLTGSNVTIGNIRANTLANVGNLRVGGLSELGPAGNVKITGGINGYFLQTDGAGNLNWAAGGGGGGNGTPGGANTQVQFNDDNNFGGDSQFTFNKNTNTLVVDFTTTVLTTNVQPNITSVGTLSSLSVSGTTSSGLFTGNGSGLTNINGSNVSTVANATYANTSGFTTTAGTVTTNAQPNITSVGTLANLTVSGNINGNGYNLTSVNGANISGTVNASNTSVYAVHVTDSSQPNITSVGTLGNLFVTNTVTANLFSGVLSGPATTAGTVTTGAQPNITSVGTLANLTVSGNTTSGVLRTDNLQYANGVAWSFPGTYGNSNVANFMPTYTGILNPSDITIISGSAKNLAEPVQITASSPTSTQNIDVITNTVWYFTTGTAQNTTVNFRGNSTTTLNSVLSTGESMTVGIVLTNPASVGYIISTVQVDGTNQTIRWINGSPSAVTNGYDCYVFTLIKTASNTYLVVGNRGTAV